MRVTTPSCSSSGLATLRSCKWSVPRALFRVEVGALTQWDTCQQKPRAWNLRLKDACAKCAAALLQVQFPLPTLLRQPVVKDDGLAFSHVAEVYSEASLAHLALC